MHRWQKLRQQTEIVKTSGCSYHLWNKTPHPEVISLSYEVESITYFKGEINIRKWTVFSCGRKMTAVTVISAYRRSGNAVHMTSAEQFLHGGSLRNVRQWWAKFSITCVLDSEVWNPLMSITEWSRKTDTHVYRCKQVSEWERNFKNVDVQMLLARAGFPFPVCHTQLQRTERMLGEQNRVTVNEMTSNWTLDIGPGLARHIIDDLLQLRQRTCKMGTLTTHTRTESTKIGSLWRAWPSEGDAFLQHIDERWVTTSSRKQMGKQKMTPFNLTQTPTNSTHDHRLKSGADIVVG